MHWLPVFWHTKLLRDIIYFVYRCVSLARSYPIMDAISLPPSVVTLPPDVDISSGSVSIQSDESIDVLDGVLNMSGDENTDIEHDMNGFDDAVESCDEEEQHNQLMALAEHTDGVPSPLAAKLLVLSHYVAEFYSPPRVLPVANAKGLSGCLSLDIITGWDFQNSELRCLSLDLLATLCIGFVILSPPCTIFSELQRLFNFKKMSQAMIASKWAEGMLYLKHAMDCCLRQYHQGRFFVFEHPASATSWRQNEVMRVAALPGVWVVTMDQCMCGLVSPVNRVPMRKRTKLMTNSRLIAARFAGKLCDKSHAHQEITGSEGGIRRSSWAQRYPPLMVEGLVQGILDHNR